MAEPGEHTARRVLLAGASGYIGRFVARELLRRGHTCIALVRDSGRQGGAAVSGPAALATAGCELCVAEATDPAQLASALDGVTFDAVVSCIASRSGAPADAWSVDYQANRNLLDLARRTPAGLFVLLSAICVQRPRLAFQHAKLAFERDLQESGVRYSIVRPTAFFKSLAGQVDRVKAGKPFLVFGNGSATACKPIGEADLAAYMVDCLDNPERTNRILPIGGPGAAITPSEQAALLCRLAGQPVRIRHVSPRLFDVAIALLAPLGRVFPALEAKAEFARIGRYYATESMLVWDEATQAYDADATPSYGSETLGAFYTRVLRDGLAGQELGQHKLF